MTAVNPPTPQSEHERLMRIRASYLKNLERVDTEIAKLKAMRLRTKSSTS